MSFLQTTLAASYPPFLCGIGSKEKKECSEVNQVKLDSSSKRKNQISINKKNCLVAYTTELNPVSKGIIKSSRKYNIVTVA